jgi:siroheme synthase
LQNADVVMHDALVPDEIVRMSRRDAEIISVGKRKGCHSKSQHEINGLLVEKAKQGLKVVRLKSGDPMIFGRAGEEIATMRANNVSYEIVPGVTSALAGAAEAEIPLTLRGTASSAVFTTGHDLKGDLLPDWPYWKTLVAAMHAAWWVHWATCNTSRMKNQTPPLRSSSLVKLLLASTSTNASHSAPKSNFLQL